MPGCGALHGMAKPKAGFLSTCESTYPVASSQEIYKSLEAAGGVSIFALLDFFRVSKYLSINYTSLRVERNITPKELPLRSSSQRYGGESEHGQYRAS